MIQRFLFQAIKDGLADIAVDPSILEEIFSANWELTDAEVEVIKTYFTTSPPTVHHGYPRKDHDLPFYTIMLADESEDTHFIGDDAAPVYDVMDDDYGVDIDSAIWGSTYYIHCVSDHPDVTLYIYDVLKSIFISASPYFNDRGFIHVGLAGTDLALDPQYMPENWFIRRLTVKVDYEHLRLNRSTKLGKAFEVRGIHVDKSGSPSDVGGVQTLVTLDPETA